MVINTNEKNLIIIVHKLKYKINHDCIKSVLEHENIFTYYFAFESFS